MGLTRGGTLLRVSDEHEANDDKLDLTDCAEFVQSNPELRVVSHPSGKPVLLSVTIPLVPGACRLSPWTNKSQS